MKITSTVVMIAACLALQAMAAGTDNNNSPSATTKGTKVPERVYQVIAPKTAPTDKIDRYGGVSSRPWAQTVSSAQQSTRLPSDREKFYEPHFNLFWFGATPK